MKMFMSDRRQREACLEITSPLPDTAVAEAKRMLSVTEPPNEGVYVGAEYRFHSMLGPGELRDAFSALADTLWGFLNA